jgi:hypothetical protein
VEAIAAFLTNKLGAGRAVLAVVLAGAIVTYGGVSLFVAYFVLAPMAAGLFRAADIPRRLMPAAIALGSSTFTMSALPGTPAIPNTIPMPFFDTTTCRLPALIRAAARSAAPLGCTRCANSTSLPSVGPGAGPRRVRAGAGAGVLATLLARHARGLRIEVQRGLAASELASARCPNADTAYGRGPL